MIFSVQIFAWWLLVVDSVPWLHFVAFTKPWRTLASQTALLILQLYRDLLGKPVKPLISFIFDQLYFLDHFDMIFFHISGIWRLYTVIRIFRKSPKSVTKSSQKFGLAWKSIGKSIWALLGLPSIYEKLLPKVWMVNRWVLRTFTVIWWVNNYSKAGWRLDWATKLKS